MIHSSRSHWRGRIQMLRNKLAVREGPKVEWVAATDVRRGEKFEFSGDVFTALKVTYLGAGLVEVDAESEESKLLVNYLSFETVKVFLPRPKVAV